MKEKVLVVDDEADIRELIQYNLEQAGYEVLLANDGAEALVKTRETSPRLIVLDLLMPGLGGLQVCKKLRQDPATKNIPVIMLTAKGEEEDIIAGLNIGADDYITKPFSLQELIARVQALLRRSAYTPGETRMESGGLMVDTERHEVFLDGDKLDVTCSELYILYVLLCKEGGVMTRAQIVSAIRGGEMTATERSVDVHITSIRKKMGDSGARIQTIRGIGYKLVD